MKLTYKSSKLTYKTLFSYSLVVIALLIVAMPVLANNNPGGKFLGFSFKADTGHTMQNAQPLRMGLNLNHIKPGEENWYVYNRHSFDEAEMSKDISVLLSWVSLAMRYESESAIDLAQVNFQVFANQQDNSWFRQPSETPQESLGTGVLSPLRKNNQKLIETFWTDRVSEEKQYYIRVYNRSPFELDYTLEATLEQPAVSGAIPAAINSATGKVETLNLRQLAWTLTAQATENMTAVQAAQWMQNAQAVGWLVTAGTLPEDIPDPGQADPHLLWNLTAQAIEGQDAATAAQWLIQADALGWLAIPPGTLKNPYEELARKSKAEDQEGDGSESPPARPVQPDDGASYTPINIYPNNPLPFNFNEVNSGRLPPYGEHWYELIRDDLDETLIEDLKLTMFYTPNQGFLNNQINFEIFPAGQYHIWLRGDADYMENIGLGMWVSRDKDPNTSERLWAGSLVDGDRYLIKVKNGTSEVVDYYLFPNDVENAELGNPTLHKIDGSVAGRIPDEASPDTRPGPPPEPGSGPPEALPLKVGVTEGVLEAGEEIWYKFYYTDPYNDKSPEHDFIFYLTNTPLNDIRARHADFEIYPGAQLHLWARGTTDELHPMGASAPATFAKLEDERSLQVLWNGQLREEHVYFVKVYNHDIGPLEYKLEIKGGP
jgi:hypothetical protein